MLERLAQVPAPRDARGDDLADRLADAENTSLKPLCSLGRGLPQDFDASPLR